MMAEFDGPPTVARSASPNVSFAIVSQAMSWLFEEFADAHADRVDARLVVGAAIDVHDVLEQPSIAPCWVPSHSRISPSPFFAMLFSL